MTKYHEYVKQFQDNNEAGLYFIDNQLAKHRMGGKPAPCHIAELKRNIKLDKKGKINEIYK